MGDLENDMDELFRKAANHYPLKTDGADWDKLMGKLPDAVGTPLPIIEQKADKSSRKLLWLILLFPMGWLCNSYFNNKDNNDKNISSLVTDTLTKKLDKQLQTIDNNANRQVGTNKITTIVADNTTQTSSSIDGIKVAESKPTTNSNKPIITNNKGTQILGDPKEDYIERTFTTNNAEKTLELRNATQKEIEHKDRGDELPQNFTQPQNIIIPQSTIDETKKLSDTAIIKLAVSTKEKDSLQTKFIDTTKKIVKKVENKITAKNKGFYVSVLGGVDASNVKSQGVKKAGYSYGMLIGYNLNKHIAIETGLLFDKKQYYTDGEYFNKSRTTIPNTVNLLDVNGNCNMFELPIDFRYNIISNKKSLFFGTAGVSSYFMKKEAYGYNALYSNGTQWYYMKTYNNSGNNLFSIIDLSVGYEHKIGKLVSLRINPYLKIPLKGLGIGSLPITSAGVNIGITVPFHK